MLHVVVGRLPEGTIAFQARNAQDMSEQLLSILNNYGATSEQVIQSLMLDSAELLWYLGFLLREFNLTLEVEEVEASEWFEEGERWQERNKAKPIWTNS